MEDDINIEFLTPSQYKKNRIELYEEEPELENSFVKWVSIIHQMEFFKNLIIFIQ